MSGERWNLLLGTPIYSDVGNGQVPTIGGGSWVAGLPLANLQDRRLSRVARSTNLVLANTQFEVDLKTLRPIRVIALPKHNLSLASKVRIRAWTGAGGTGTNTYDSGWIPGVTKPINRLLNSESFAAWTLIGTPTRTAPYGWAGDINTELIGDDDAAAIEGYRQSGLLLVGDGVKGFKFRAVQGTATKTRIDLADTTAVINRIQMEIQWPGGIPVLAFAASSGSQLSAPARAPNNAWDFEVASAAVVAANAHRLDIYPACDLAGATAALQGNLSMGGFHLDDAPVPREYTRTEAAIAGVDTTGMNAGFVLCPYNSLDIAVISRYFVIEIDDATNAAGYVDVARVVLAGGVQPSVNVNYGMKLGMESETERGVTDGGAALYNVRPRRRTLTAVLPNMPEEEAMRLFYQLHQREGISGQVMVVYDPTDVYQVHRRSFLAVQRDMSPLERAMYARDTLPLNFVEEL